METELKEELCCPICTDLFTSPLRLPCGHSYCQSCLRAMVKHPEPRRAGNLSRWLHEDEGGEEIILSCPECRREYILDERGVDRFQSDFKLAKLVELYRKLDMTSLTDSESEEDSKRWMESKPADISSVPPESLVLPSSRASYMPTETCEVLSNIPTELCSETLLKQVAVDTVESGDTVERSTSLPDSVSLNSCASATAEIVPQFQENYFSDVEKGESRDIEPRKSPERSLPAGACATVTRTQNSEPVVCELPRPPLVLPSGHYDNLHRNNIQINQSTPNLLRIGPNALPVLQTDLTRGQIHASKSANDLVQNVRGDQRPLSSIVPESTSGATGTTSTSSAMGTTSASRQSSRHGNESPKFPSGNYDNLLDSAAVNQILASATSTPLSNPPTSNPSTSGLTSNQVPRYRTGSSQSLSSSNSRSSKSANELYDNLRKQSKGAVSLGCSSKQTNSSDDSKHKESDCSDNNMHMTSSVKVTRRRRKKKRNRVASFFSSLLFSESSSSGDYLTSDSEDERKRQDQNQKRQRHRTLFYSSSSS